MKFGGTSVGDVAAFERVFHIVSTQLEWRPVVVVSAMTKVTDALLAASEGPASAHVHAVFAGRSFTIVGGYQYEALRTMLRVRPSSPSNRRA